MKKGFTLIELLLYVAIASSVLIVSTLFITTLFEARIKNQTIAEVEQQGLAVMQVITQTVRNAENITSPTTGNSGSSLTLDVLSGADDPTVFDLSGGAIRIREGGGSAVNLTNSRVTASSLTFTNLTSASTPGMIRVSFTLTHNNPTGRYEYDFDRTFYAGASLRQP